MIRSPKVVSGIWESCSQFSIPSRSMHCRTLLITSTLTIPARMSSQSIHKLRVLPISQIQPLLVLKLNVRRIRTNESFLRILTTAIPVDEQHVQQTHAPASDDCDLGGNVTGRVLRSEGLRADDVADARGCKSQRKEILRSSMLVDWADALTNTRSNTEQRLSSSSCNQQRYC
jgi:hypothetical protein